MLNLVIVAGGLGSRLAPLTNYIPKFLVNTGKETGLVEQIRYWKKFGLESITLIVHSNYKDLVQAYYDMYFKDDPDLMSMKSTPNPESGFIIENVRTPLYIKTVDVANGSAHAIMSTCDHLYCADVLFQWCDVLPAVNVDVYNLQRHAPTVFTNYDHQNRYGLGPQKKGMTPVPTPDGSGGVFGLYFVPEFHELDYEDGQDFIEIISKYNHYNTVLEHVVDKIVDWGDKPKLEWTRSKADKARSFNSVEFHGDLVLKRGLNAQGAKLMQREMAWYEELDLQGSKVNRPKVWTANDSFVMTKIKDSVSVWEHWPLLDDEGRRDVLGRVIGQLNLLHSTRKIEVNPMQVRQDVKSEAYDKLMDRYAEIEGVIKAFGPIDTVNGYEFGGIPDARALIHATWEKLDRAYRDVTEYSLIHGDLQFSNSMINQSTHEVTFIDPRGYFGKTNLYGLPDYDFSKLMYALSGYDLFNYSKDFHLGFLGDGAIEFNIPRPATNGLRDLFSQTFTETHKLWLAVIWQGLAQYIKNDPVKSVAAHYHGLMLMHDLNK